MSFWIMISERSFDLPTILLKLPKLVALIEPPKSLGNSSFIILLFSSLKYPICSLLQPFTINIPRETCWALAKLLNVVAVGLLLLAMFFPKASLTILCPKTSVTKA